MKLDKRERRQDDHPPGYPCRVYLFFLLPPPTGSRMTVVDLSNFGDLQARGRGDQPANCNNYIVLMLLFLPSCVYEKYQDIAPLGPKKNKNIKAGDERYKERSSPKWSVLFSVHLSESSHSFFFSLFNLSLA